MNVRIFESDTVSTEAWPVTNCHGGATVGAASPIASPVVSEAWAPLTTAGRGLGGLCAPGLHARAAASTASTSASSSVSTV
eukprot:7377431-Prymnesium_polylepis.2